VLGVLPRLQNALQEVVRIVVEPSAIDKGGVDLFWEKPLPQREDGANGVAGGSPALGHEQWEQVLVLGEACFQDCIRR